MKKEYDEFCVEISPRPEGGAPWSLFIAECPPGVPEGLKGAAGIIQTPALTRDDLRKLRSGDVWPDSVLLRDIGRRVWSSVMNPKVAEAFASARASAKLRKRGLRVTLVTRGERDAPFGAQIATSELPFEVLCDTSDNYVAVQPDITVSRRPYPQPESGPAPIDLPLRIMVAVSTPLLLNFDAAKELAVIQEAFAGVTDRVSIEIVQPATRPAFAAALQKAPHVVHFIGHGGFASVGEEGTQVGYLAFMKDTGEIDPVDASDFEAFFEGTDVRLVVLTACASAAPMPDVSPYPLTAMDGVAQRLVGGQLSRVAAVVAMQFDLEQPAAVAFAAGFYEGLLDPSCSLDEAVNRGRRKVRQAPGLGTAHRAWVTPTLHWRSRGSHVFEVFEELSPADQAKLGELNRTIAKLREVLGKVGQAGPAEIPGYILFAITPIEMLVDATRQRALVVRRAARLDWIVANAGSGGEVQLFLSSATAEPIESLEVDLSYPADCLSLVSVTPEPVLPDLTLGPTADLAADTAPVDPAAGAAAPVEVSTLTTLRITLRNAAPVAWPTGERCVARIKLDVASPDGRARLADLDLSSVWITQGGQKVAGDDIDGGVVIDPRPAP